MEGLDEQTGEKPQQEGVVLAADGPRKPSVAFLCPCPRYEVSYSGIGTASYRIIHERQRFPKTLDLSCVAYP